MNLPHYADKYLDFLIAWGLGGAKPHACGAAAFVNASRIDMDMISDTSGRNLLSFHIECKRDKTRRNIGHVQYHLRRNIPATATLFYSVTNDV